MQKLKTMLVALFVLSIAGSAALAQQYVYVQPGRYEIQIASTGKVLDLRKEDNRSVQQFYRGNVQNQQWDIQSAGGNTYYIRSAQNGAYLTVEGNGNGARVVATNGRGDTWRFMDLGNGNMMIVSRAGMALDLTNGDTRDGALIQVWSQARNANQQFRLVPLANASASYDPRNPGRGEFNEAYRAGVADRSANLSRNYRRHREMYDRNSEGEFARNYNNGYDNGRYDTNYDGLNNMTAAQRRNYDEGYRLGQQDARAGYRSDYRRYNNRYNRQQEPFFQRGYEAGYDNRGSNNDQFDLNRLSAAERRVYDDGYRLGQQDARARRALDYRRYRTRYNSRQEDLFQRGYEVGYNNVRRY